MKSPLHVLQRAVTLDREIDRYTTVVVSLEDRTQALTSQERRRLTMAKKMLRRHIKEYLQLCALDHCTSCEGTGTMGSWAGQRIFDCPHCDGTGRAAAR